MKKRVRTACNTSCRDLSEDKWALTGQHSVGTEDQRDTHLNHRNKPLTLRFSGSTVFKPIKKQGRGQQGTVSNIQKIKTQNVISY